MIGKTSPRLQANDIFSAPVDKINHIACKEPAFAGYVAERQVFFSFVGNFVNRGNGVETFAGSDGFSIRLTIPIEKLDCRFAAQGGPE